ncbi:MAG: hypothetical protein LUO89_15405 [Methanothrix sp.]|nr:hypothetical protein [Methanothrix sp.]
MMDICRRILCIGLASLLFVGLSGMSLAEPNESRNMDETHEGRGPHDAEMMPPENAGFPMGVPEEVLYSGHGFALMGNESHILRLKVETIMPLEPDQIRDLLASNKSLEEIRDDIMAKEGETGEKTYRGSLILDRSIYPLIDIVVSSASNNSTALKADLADLGPLSTANDTAILGSLFVIISPSDGGMIGKGELNIDQGQPATRYSLLLDLEPPRHSQKQMMMGR